MAPKQHVAGVEHTHRLVTQHGKAVLFEVTAPPARAEQPQLAQRGAPFTVPARKQSAAYGSCGAIPRFTEAPPFGCSRKRTRQKVRQAGDQVERSVRIARDNGPKAPGGCGQDMDATPSLRQHALYFGMYANEIGDVLEHVRREHDIETGIREGQISAVVIR